MTTSKLPESDASNCENEERDNSSWGFGGADPAEERAQSRAAITIREVCNWYLENAEAGMILGKGHVLGVERFDKGVGVADWQRLERCGLDQSQNEATFGGTTVPAFGLVVVQGS